MTPEPRTLWSPGGRFDIEALRALAVTAVILFHAGVPFLGGGFIGVDIFFVISGYLIIGLIYRGWQQTGKVSLLGFWARRARRLLPASSLVLAVTALLAWPLSGRITGQEIRYDLLAALGFSANLRFGFSKADYWAPKYESPVLHFWSLGVEEQYYIITPLAFLLLALLIKRVKSRQQAVTFAVVSAVSLASLTAALAWAHVDTVWNYYSPFTRGWEFAAGGLVALMPATKLSTLWRRVLAWSGWLGLVGSIFLIKSGAGWPGIATLAPVTLTLLVIYVGAGSATCREFLARGKRRWATAVAWLGGISYSAYLWHWPLLWVAARASGAAATDRVSPWLAALAIVVSLWLASLTKYLVEDPIRFSPRLAASSWRSLGVAWLTAGVSAALVMGASALPVWNLRPAPEVIEAPVKPVDWKDSNPDWLRALIDDLAPQPNHLTSLATVVPGVSSVGEQEADAHSTGCQLEFYELQAPDDCVFGYEEGEKSIVLFGDSHAGQFFTGLNSAADQLGYQLYVRTRTGCPAAMVTKYDARVDGPYAQCDSWRNSVLSEIAAIQPDLVIMTSYLTLGSTYNEGTGLTADNPDLEVAIWQAGYVNTITQLTKAGIPVIVVRDTPMWGMDVPDCLSSFEPKRCAPKLNGLLNDSAIDIDLANQMTLVRGIDLTMAICEPSVCFPVRGGDIVMRDHSHLSNEYSAALGPLWRAIIVHELQSEPIAGDLG